MSMYISLRAFCSFSEKRWNQMPFSIRWPQWPAILSSFVWKFIFKIDWDIAIQSLCSLVPSYFEQRLRNSTHQETRSWAMCPENMSAIGTVVAEIRHFKVGILQGCDISGFFKTGLPKNYQTVCYDIYTTERVKNLYYSIQKWWWFDNNYDC